MGRMWQTKLALLEARAGPNRQEFLFAEASLDRRCTSVDLSERLSMQVAQFVRQRRDGSEECCAR